MNMMNLGSNNYGMSDNFLDNSKFAEIDELLAESLGSLMGVKGLKRANLLLGGSDKAGVSVPSIELRRALLQLFRECKGSDEGLSMRDIQQSFHLCRQTVPNTYMVKTIMKSYHTCLNEAGKKHLSESGFLKYYTDAVNELGGENTVRGDLSAFGYRNDLTRRSGASIERNEDGRLSMSR